MNDPGRHDEMEDLLRKALGDAAARVHPAGDGLDRIRERARHRRGWLSGLRPGLRPGLAAVVAIATAAVAVAVPLALYSGDPGSGGAEQALGAVPTAPASPKSDGSGTPTPSPFSATASEPATGEPGSGTATSTHGQPSLPDMVTVWPYGSRREGFRRADHDVAKRLHPELRDPRDTALTFVRSFVGTGHSLVADDGSPLAAGIGITVSTRAEDGDLAPVSLVYLVRVRRGDDSPYVVVDASEPKAGPHRDAMTVRPGTVHGTSAMTVAGTVVGLSEQPRIASVKVELRDPGDDQTLASQSPALSADPDHTGLKMWTAMLTPIRPLSAPTGTVAAWSVDADNDLLAFVAAPTG